MIIKLPKNENKIFIGSILFYSVGYLIITLFINNVRTSYSLWLVWPLLIIQFVLYFYIFIAGYRRSIVMGLNKEIAFFGFIILAILGRINDWEILVIPLLMVICIIFSVRNKKLSTKSLKQFKDN